jgi:hypothetical protein
MHAAALAIALCALVAAALPSPGLFVAIGLGIAAIGTGWLGYRARGAPGFRRLAGAAAITIGAMSCSLGVVRVGFALAAIDRIDHMIGPK